MRTITNLRSFLSALEKLDDAHTRLPSYNTDPRWANGVNKVRRFHDIAAAVLATGANGIGIEIGAGTAEPRTAEKHGFPTGKTG